MFYLTVLLTIIVCLLSIVCVFKQFLRPSNFPPGPKWLPIVGNSPIVKHLSILHGGFHNALMYLSQKYKTQILGLKLGKDLFVVVFSKDLIRQVFTQEEFQARPDSYFIRLRTMGIRRGITMTDGDLWQEQRNFAVRHLRSLGFGKSHMESLIVEELRELLMTLGEGGDCVALHSQLAPCVLNVLWALTAGSRFNADDPQLVGLLQLMADRSKAFDMAGGVLSQLPCLALLAPEWSGYNLICSLNNQMKGLLEKTIQEHRKSLDINKNRDFIDAFLKEIDVSNGSPTTFTEEQLVMVCLDFFIAGSQTTSNTLSFALLNMILHQDIQERVYQEIREVLGTRKLPTLEDKQRLPYVEAVLMESQRFLHVVPVAGPRRVLSQTTLDQYTIPKDATVLLCLYSMHHDEKMWDQPMKFLPDRFLGENNKVLTDDLCQFGIGKRRCLGEALARNFCFLFFTGILRNFHLGVPTGMEPPSLNPIPGIVLSPRPYSIHITPR
ncbi:methyl farnesoate epoxidase [Homalodisca vitripennis]|uniref:methyl farnesoate epoxidase n=1 Tax=Homalodisca vitripennis TaxID=197043 RepID=UPI001EEC36DF|nr:methyl farnesoate epoxidase [Homalodisca vitripennis]XP_046674343.1 methyl farnesoate epoxidase [Homalodisca vitripennis]